METETHYTTDKLHVVRALRVTVASPVLGAGLVRRGHPTVDGHLAEVERAVKAAPEVGHVDVERELLVEELEHLVVGLVGHEVDAGPDVGASDELERQGVAAGGDPVRAAVVGAVERAVGRAGRGVRAEGLVPGVAGVAARTRG